MNKEEICFLPAFEMKEKIASQELSSIEITEAIIERITKINPIINAYCTTTFDLAREMAKEADNRVKKGEKSGLLNGIPTSIKDLNQVKGVRTTFGSKIYEFNVPKEDSIAVARLRKEGCVILGKTNTPEFGFKGVTDNLIFGASKNPWNLERTTGGSSGGAAAATASGLSPLAQGSDGGGSIRHPAGLCGIYGLKPNYGRVPLYPREFIAAYDLGVVGPLVRYVKDAALMLDAMKGPSVREMYMLPKDGTSYYEVMGEKPKKLKIGYSIDLGYAKLIDSEVEKAVIDSAQKFEKFDWKVEEVKLKIKKPERSFLTMWTSLFAYDLKPKLEKWGDKLDPALLKLVQAGLSYGPLDLPKAIAERRKFHENFMPLFDDYDILITPTTAITAFELGIPFPTKINNVNVSPTAWQPFTFPFNMTGQPAATIPCGWSKEGLPIGMQIVGKPFDEKTVLQVSKAFEEISPWQDKRPTF
jgi:aspartyl-tRNA(Asn)/glutamyl-tRNA(Gln) amidotransferase subunit A